MVRSFRKKKDKATEVLLRKDVMDVIDVGAVASDMEHVAMHDGEEEEVVLEERDRLEATIRYAGELQMSEMFREARNSLKKLVQRQHELDEAKS